MISSFSKTPERTQISGVVRDLRKERGWTQTELAGRLGLSQNRLSEIERGDGSFTAEQFLRILQLFNVAPSRFIGNTDRSGQLQNALARLGAGHLTEIEGVVPADDLFDGVTAIRETLIDGDPRLTAALAPVLIANIDRVGLNKLYLDLERIGFERRVAWLVENTLSALSGHALLNELPRTWLQRARRSEVVLKTFLSPLRNRVDLEPTRSPADIFDPRIRSQKTLEAIQRERSNISRVWNIVSALQPQDFENAIRAASAASP
jgi:transcriptional regulator with XRE-family HTH domain